jgi:hypothetical protein
MKMKQTAKLYICTLAVFLSTLASLAQAKSTRTWVSGVGADASPCSRTTPCKTFATAISRSFVTRGGRNYGLDKAGFGQTTVNKSLTSDGTAKLTSIPSGGTTSMNTTDIRGNDLLHNITLRELSRRDEFDRRGAFAFRDVKTGELR